ncbi:MAG: acid phosphatase [Pseudomonadota bacterium]|nr:acid phosphatase [Pseudomonadota bacterium]
MKRSLSVRSSVPLSVSLAAPRSVLLSAASGALLLLGSCTTLPSSADRAVAAIDTLVVIYAENRAFDTLYGLYPGANGVPGVNPSAVGAAVPQKDFDGSVLPVLPPIWGGATANGQAVTLSQAQTAGLPNRPFRIDDPAGLNGTGVVLGPAVATRDLVHRYYNNMMQISGGSNDRFAAYSDAGALSMGYYDGSRMKLWSVARQYTLADNFFMGAFGGSFLNHQYLVCACAPVYPDVAASPARNAVSAILTDPQGRFLGLTPAAGAPVSVLAGPPRYLQDGALTPIDAAGASYAVNTVQPFYQPSANAPAAGADPRFSDPSKASTLPAQGGVTIGDRLDARNVPWAWYAGAWNLANQPTAEGRSVIYANPAQFQPHHQPFNYYRRFDPASGAAARRLHLKDFDADFLADASGGKLPPVTFYKPQGNLNQHAGYANVADGDAHIAEVVAKLQQSPQWPHMLIVITYDENGGFYDHAPVPRGDRWGPGNRIPAVFISPYVRTGYVDKTQYDTGSILRFITRRWSLEPLPGIVERDAALRANGMTPMGDLSEALVARP